MIRRAFTLVELLVVITIIGILIGLLIPAVNAAREAGRRAQCANNVKQLAAACLQHEEAQGYFPSGGWGYNWVGDPTLGPGGKQPGSWFFSILSHLENDNLYKVGGSDPLTHVYSATAMQDGATRMATALPMINCPSRRRAVPYPCGYTSGGGVTGGKYTPINANPATMVARSDYAANVGNEDDSALQWAGPTSMGSPNTPQSGLWYAANNWLGYDSRGFPFARNGVIFIGSQIRKDDVTDGLSNTYLLGEKYLSLDHYTNGIDRGDNLSVFTGCDDDNERSTSNGTPMQDHSGQPMVPRDYNVFGGPHADSCCFAFCDGSVHWIRFSINAQIHSYLGQRNDTNTIDTSQL